MDDITSTPPPVEVGEGSLTGHMTQLLKVTRVGDSAVVQDRRTVLLCTFQK